MVYGNREGTVNQLNTVYRGDKNTFRTGGRIGKSSYGLFRFRGSPGLWHDIHIVVFTLYLFKNDELRCLS